jgi:predicted RNA binding protein YcfA (HicA-like mRNA interferase family)
VKRKALIKQLVALGAVYLREGAQHTLYQNPRTAVELSVPRHTEVSKHVTKQLLRDASG